ncbi:L,D-transpeptidase [Mesorhizobium sp. M1066]|uniref:L,D-transpeptidase n=1 Tax=unclassified Mesorhizobium TaxID=325217 RepID=UPI00333CCFDC
MPADGKLTRETWDKLVATSSRPALETYELTRKDVRGPFTKRIPARMERMARLPRLAYHNALEKMAERFHISEQLLERLNPGIGFRKAGQKLLVPAVARGDPPQDIGNVEVDKSARQVRVLDPSGKVLATYPASIGSQEKPAPSGEAEVKRVVRHPTYHYDPEFAFKGAWREACTIQEDLRLQHGRTDAFRFAAVKLGVVDGGRVQFCRRRCAACHDEHGGSGKNEPDHGRHTPV